MCLKRRWMHSAAKIPSHKGQNGDQIPQAVVPGPLKQIGAEQHNVAGLGVGKNAAPAEIGIGVLKAAGYDDEGGCQHGFGHLAPQSMDKHSLHQAF